MASTAGSNMGMLKMIINKNEIEGIYGFYDEED